MRTICDLVTHSGFQKKNRPHPGSTLHSEPQVDAFYEATLAAGAKDNGAQRFRHPYHQNDYTAFIYDPDGYNIEAVFHGVEAPPQT